MSVAFIVLLFISYDDPLNFSFTKLSYFSVLVFSARHPDLSLSSPIQISNIILYVFLYGLLMYSLIIFLMGLNKNEKKLGLPSKKLYNV